MHRFMHALITYSGCPTLRALWSSQVVIRSSYTRDVAVLQVSLCPEPSSAGVQSPSSLLSLGLDLVPYISIPGCELTQGWSELEIAPSRSSFMG